MNAENARVVGSRNFRRYDFLLILYTRRPPSLCMCHGKTKRLQAQYSTCITPHARLSCLHLRGSSGPSVWVPHAKSEQQKAAQHAAHGPDGEDGQVMHADARHVEPAKPARVMPR